jgi:hypothetical protein
LSLEFRITIGEAMRAPKARRWLVLTSASILAAAVAPLASAPPTAAAPAPAKMHIDCSTGTPLCTEVADSEEVFGEGNYVGHDEPAATFYDSHAGAGNNATYVVRLPKDPPTPPKQDGTGGTFNFQLHPAFWFGMALCDNQSAPEFTHAACKPDSDTNIFDGANPNAADYIGKHPGTDFLEVQFFPPGWVPWPAGFSCDASKRCAAMAIFSLSQDQNTGTLNNANCLATAGVEPANFAFITRNGHPHAPPSPLAATAATFTPNPAPDLFMSSGDQIVLSIRDSRDGLRADLIDLSARSAGSMTASAANQFAQINFEPTAATCSQSPYTFRPMYASSSEHTRVPWAAHTYNIAMSDEIGHFEYCDAVDAEGGNCTAPGGADRGNPPDGDDTGCFSGATSLRIHVGGCIATENDFDGTSYVRDWPGSTTPNRDRLLHPEAIQFTSPVFNGFHRYARSGFEADLPRIEAADTIDPKFPPCDRSTGANCVNPPPGAQFYPLFTTRGFGAACHWQLGGPNIPGTTNTFGGSSTTEFGALLTSVYPGPTGTPITRINNFRRVLNHTPC